MAPRLTSVLLVTAYLLVGSTGRGAATGAVRSDEMRWTPPVAPVRVVAEFDPPVHRWLPGHRGIDLRTTPGTKVRAAGAGRVTFASSLAGRGVVTIDHGGLRTTYEPVDPLVARGDAVGLGGIIGTVGTGTGHCGSGRCLHLGLRRGSEYLDPGLLLGRVSARLLPW